MPGLLSEIAAKAIKTVTIDGVLWHIHSATSHDTLRSGVAMLLALQFDPAKEKLSEKSLLDVYKRMGAEGAAQNQTAKEGLVCAGVSHVQREGSEEVEPCSLVHRADHHKPEQGKLWVGYLRKETVDVLYMEILGLSTDAGGALERAATFRAPSNGAPAGAFAMPSVLADPETGA